MLKSNSNDIIWISFSVVQYVKQEWDLILTESTPLLSNLSNDKAYDTQLNGAVGKYLSILVFAIYSSIIRLKLPNLFLIKLMFR